MNKKIIVSLSVIGLVAAIAIGGTIAYFSDTETSAGNLFAAGSIDLEIDNHCFYNGDECYCTDPQDPQTCTWQTGPNAGQLCTCTWGLTNLDGELFFNFTDLKPGDWGEDTVSLHVYNNDAWACVTFDNMVDDDNGCTEPEEEDGDSTCGDDEGELSQYLYFFFWADMCFEPEIANPGDNVFQPWCEEPLMAGWANEILPGTTYTLAAPGYDNVFTGVMDEPLTGSDDYYIGKVWCFGELDWIPGGPMGAIFTCDGEPVDNIPQTDSLEADIIFYAEQSRNNPNFTCVQPIRYTSSPQNYSGTGWAGWSCPPEHPTAVGGGVIGNAYPMGAQGIAVPGATIGGSTYPIFPHYTYGTWYSGETGYVAQNGGTGQTCQIYVDCI